MKFLSKNTQKTTVLTQNHFFPDLYKGSLNEGDEVIANLSESNNRNVNSNLVYSYKSFL